MGSVGMLGMGGVVSDPNVSLPATETYASNANPVPLQIELDENRFGDEDLDDEEIEVVSNKPAIEAVSGAPTASMRNNHRDRGRTEVSNQQSPNHLSISMRQK